MSRPATFWLFLCFFGIGAQLSAQDQAPTYGEQRAAMEKLKPLLGEWEGTGWISMGPRRFDFQSSESFTEAAGGLAIVVRGIHRMPLPNGETREVHNAVALITYDAEADRYRFITQLANGRGGDYRGHLTEDGDFQWIIPDTPIGKMTYTIKASGSEYVEEGELTVNGEQRKFFEMKLGRTSQ